MIITLDGPAGSGKSTVSQLVAKHLGFEVLNTGAMYRALAYLLHQNQKTEHDTDWILRLLDETVMDFQNGELWVNGTVLGDCLRTLSVDRLVSPISAMKVVREGMVALQRKIAKGGNFVVEGRDMGSVVFPDAEYQFYLDASPQKRALRRFEENRQKGLGQMTLSEIEADIIRRDEYDKNRELSPLVIPPKAVIIDTTELSIDAVVQKILSTVR